jgi:Protein of unknown function (DUF2971)
MHHPDDTTRLQLLKAETLHASSVTRLYKYCRPETARLIMKHGLLLQAPDSYNDPFDCLAGVNVWSADHRFAPDAATVDAALSELTSLPPKYQLPKYDLYHDMRMSYSLATTCFSEQPDEHLLWSHYGDNHKGICLAFEVAVLIEELHPCAYQTAMPKAAAWRTNNIALGLIKGTAWSYEKEWRIVRKTIRPKMRVLGSLTHQISNHIHTDPHFTVSDHEEWSHLNSKIHTRLEEQYNRERVVNVRPTQVILGLNAHHQFTNVNSGACCDEIRELAVRERIPVMRMQVAPNSFDLTSVQVIDRLGWTQPLS